MVKGAAQGRTLTAFDAPLAIHAETRVSDGIRFQGWADFKGENRGGGARFVLNLDVPEDSKEPLVIDLYNAQGEVIRHIERKLDKDERKASTASPGTSPKKAANVPAGASATRSVRNLIPAAPRWLPVPTAPSSL